MPTRPDSFALDTRSRNFLYTRARPTALNPKGLSRSFVLRSTLRTYSRLLEGALPSLSTEDWVRVLSHLKGVDLSVLEYGEPPDLYALLRDDILAVQGSLERSAELDELWALLQPMTPLRAVAVLDYAHQVMAMAAAFNTRKDPLAGDVVGP